MRGLFGAALAAALLFGSPANAADPAAPAPAELPPSGWRFTATAPLWALGLNGNVGVGSLPAAGVNADFGDVLKHLKGVFATTLIARNETFIAGLDFMWSRIGVDVNVKVNGNGPYANLRSGTAVSFQQDQTIATVFAGYRIPIGSPDLSLYGTVGARYQNLTAKINLSKQFAGVVALQPLGFSLTVQGTQAWVDPLVGLAMNYRINDKWFVNGYGDVGGFGVASKLTSLGQIAVGYNWTQSFSTTLGYRALYYDYKKNNGNGGSFRYVTTMHGPVVGLSYNF